ncbi:Gfo/Idh/MocA family oxidoreductase [Candidatus Poribacteria bacterium]|nr:Gfo/Idh/MocA family oxidoreductase [Candidatus Poribacteria bacterium]
MAKHYRVGIIGCGRIAERHANAYTAIESTELVAVAEPDPERRLKFDETYGIAGLYENYREMLANKELDIISICTWHPFHCEMTVVAAESGVQAILCEKPMALNLREADQMLEACETTGTKLVIGHQHRFDPQAVNAIEFVKDNAIGELRSIFGHCSSDLLNNGTHVVDLIRYFADDSPIGWVMGQIDRPSDKVNFGHRVEHNAIGQWQFENGVYAILAQGELAPSSYAFQLCGTAGIISVNAPEGRQLQVITKNGELDVSLEKVNPKQAEVEELIGWLEGGPPHRSRGESGRATLEVLMAIMDSSRLRRAIYLPLETQESPLELMIESEQI